MSLTHTWTIENISAHKFNTNCINNIRFKLTSSDGTFIKEKEFDCGISPCRSSVDLSKDPSTFDWYDKYENFTFTEDITENILWEWIDERTDRDSLQNKMEAEFIPLESNKIYLSLPF